MRLLLSLFLALLFTSHQTSAANSVALTKTTKIHFYQPTWQKVALHYRIYQNDSFEQKTMKKANNGWWKVEIPAKKIQYFLSDGIKIADLGNVLGCYAKVHYPCKQLSEPPNYFYTQAEEIWLKKGVQFIYDPDAAKKPTNVFSVLTLNMHTYQEFSTANKDEEQLTKQDALSRVADHAPLFASIANAINLLDPDAICLQEVGEWGGVGATTGFGNHPSNAVKQILKRIDNKEYHVFMDWTHYGWQVWKEGTALLTKQAFIHQASRYISQKNKNNLRYWKSRKATHVQIDTPNAGKIKLFSTHTGWWDDKDEPFKFQFQKLTQWANETTKAETTILCGDFNQPASTVGYQYIFNNSNYNDLYLQVNPKGMLDATIGGNIAGWEGSSGGKRVDFILMNEKSPLTVIQSQRVFTEKVFGRVSDHLGIFSQLTNNGNN